MDGGGGTALVADRPSTLPPLRGTHGSSRSLPAAWDSPRTPLRSPVLVALTQCTEYLLDRQAADAVRGRTDVKGMLGLERTGSRTESVPIIAVHQQPTKRTRTTPATTRRSDVLDCARRARPRYGKTSGRIGLCSGNDGAPEDRPRIVTKPIECSRLSAALNRVLLGKLVGQGPLAGNEPGRARRSLLRLDEPAACPCW